MNGRSSSRPVFTIDPPSIRTARGVCSAPRPADARRATLTKENNETVSPMTLLTMTPFKALCDREDAGPSHPGEILREDLLPHYRMTVADLARKLGVPTSQAADLISERTGIDTALADRLGQVFALCPRYWLALQLQYDLWHKKAAEDSETAYRSPAWGAYAGAAATP